MKQCFSIIIYFSINYANFFLVPQFSLCCIRWQSKSQYFKGKFAKLLLNYSVRSYINLSMNVFHGNRLDHLFSIVHVSLHTPRFTFE